MKVFIGIPATRFVATDWWVSFINWIGDMGEKFEFKWMVDAKAGRIDWSRSNLIEAAKRWKPDWFIQLDTDIIPETDFQAVIGLLNKDRALGFDCIVSPTASVAGVVLAKPLNPPKEGENLPYDEPWEIDWAGGGFVAMSANALKKIAQIGSFASETGEATPAYCEQSLQHGEDVSMFQNLREHGVRCCADPRLKTLHMKSAPIPSYRDNPIRYIIDHGDRTRLPIYTNQLKEVLNENNKSLDG